MQRRLKNYRKSRWLNFTIVGITTFRLFRYLAMSNIEHTGKRDLYVSAWLRTLQTPCYMCDVDGLHYRKVAPGIFEPVCITEFKSWLVNLAMLGVNPNILATQRLCQRAGIQFWVVIHPWDKELTDRDAIAVWNVTKHPFKDGDDPTEHFIKTTLGDLKTELRKLKPIQP